MALEWIAIVVVLIVLVVLLIASVLTWARLDQAARQLRHDQALIRQDIRLLMDRTDPTKTVNRRP